MSEKPRRGRPPKPGGPLSTVARNRRLAERKRLALERMRDALERVLRSADHEAARAVGVALATNPWPLIVPCHRVVSASDKMTGFSAPGGVRTKTRLLTLEGAELLSE